LGKQGATVRAGVVRVGALPYTRVVGGREPDEHATAMTRAASRTVALATVTAMLLALVAIGPVAAGSITRDPAAEAYALRLLNCTRTGGFVRANGTCADRGSGTYSAYRKPLRLHRNISTKVALPWARTMVQHGICAHELPGKPKLSRRMTSKGFRFWTYGENVGCSWGSTDAKAVVLATHRAMQAEKKDNGGHWQNIKNPRYKSVGIAVAKGSGRIMVVWDFYGKRF
jgi:hypothetical protein